jgi:hypothetical protein
MVRHLEETLAAITQADAITPDPIDGRWRYWRSGVGPTRWLFVVVDWHETEPCVITAYGQPRIRLRNGDGCDRLSHL